MGELRSSEEGVGKVIWDGAICKMRWAREAGHIPQSNKMIEIVRKSMLKTNLNFCIGGLYTKSKLL